MAEEHADVPAGLRALLRANSAVGGDRSLRIVLRHIVLAAKELAGARCGALGVLGEDGTLEEFVHVGEVPRGERVDDLPLATGVLCIPIRIRDHVFGNLYLAESVTGTFSAENEELVTALAITAGVAIENARLFEESEKRRRWQSVSTDATQKIFATSGEAPHEVVLRFTRQGADSDFAFLAVLRDDDRVSVELAVGALSTELATHGVPLGRSLIEPVLRGGKAVLVNNYAQHAQADPHLRHLVGSFMAVPLLTDQRVVAALVAGRLTGGRSFDSVDLDQLSAFATCAGVALELDRARDDREAVSLLTEHDRIAADLHDHVVQELFATGMGLQSLVGRITVPEVRTRLLVHVEALDATIRRIRNTIFELHRPLLIVDSLKHQVRTVVRESAPALGFEATVEFRGPLDLAVPRVLADDVVAVVRETVSNAARHAQASQVHVVVALAEGLLTVTVTDDGVGLVRSERNSGLGNLDRRARRHGGDLAFAEPPGGGVVVGWTASCVS